MIRKTILHIGVYSFLTKAVSTVLFFVAQVFASRLLLKDDFGQAQYILWLSSFCWMLFHFGVPALFARFLPVISVADRKVLFKKALRSLAITVVLGILFTLFQTVSYTFSIRALAVVMVAAHAVNAFLSSAGIGLLQNRQLLRAQIPAGLGMLGWMWFFRNEFTTVDYLEAIVVYYTLYSLLLFFAGFDKRDETEQCVSLPSDRSLTRMSVAYYLSALLAALVWQRTELFVLGHWFTSNVVADFTVALTLTALCTEPVRWVSSSYTAYFATSQHTADFYLRLHTLNWSITCFVCAFAWFFADDLIHVLFGANFPASVEYMRYLVPLTGLGVSAFPTMSFHTGQGKARFLLLQDSVAAFVFILLLGLTVVMHDVYYVFYAKAISVGLSVVIGMYYTHVHMGVRYPARLLLWPLLLTFVCAVIWFYADDISHTGALLLSVLSFIIYCWVLVKVRCIPFPLQK